MKAVIYARYSSENQREESIEGQLRECKEYAERNEIIIIKNYIDRALSAKTDNRPEFQHMIKDSTKGLFDIVLVWKLDRFARNRYDSARYKAILKKNGVKVVSAKESISEGPEGIILESMLEGYAEYYSAELSQKVSRGMKENALKAKYNGGTMPLGYTTDKDKHFVINPITAPIVQEIFTRYADGETILEIADVLNKRGLKSSKGSQFNRNSLHLMLRNRKYIGEYRYKDIVIPGGMPAIVPEELFNKVQERLQRNKKAPAREKAKVNYLLSTKLFCGKCKATMDGESGYGSKGGFYTYYKCLHAKRNKSCDKKAVKKDKLEDLIIEITKNRILQPKTIEWLADSIYNLQSKENDKIIPIKQNLKEVEKSINNMLNAIQQGIVTPSTKQRLEELEQQKADLEIALLNEEIEHPVMSKEFIKQWINSFGNMNLNEERNRQQLIDTFINSIYLYDDKVIIIYNFKDGTDKITLDEVECSDLVQCAVPKFDCSFYTKLQFFCIPNALFSSGLSVFEQLK